MARDDFERAIAKFDLGDRTLSRIARATCRAYTVWPDALLGNTRYEHSNYPGARRVAWRIAFILTDLAIENIAVIGGRTPATVRPWARSWAPFEKAYGWHRFRTREPEMFPWWEKHVEVTVGPLCDALGVPEEEMPGYGVGAGQVGVDRPDPDLTKANSVL